MQNEEIINKINEYEKGGLWHVDVLEDPKTYPLYPNKIDYLNKKLSSKMKNKLANFLGARFFDKMIAKTKTIADLRGL